MSLTLAALPLVLLIVLMVSPRPAGWLPLPATRALPLNALLAYGLQWLYFRAGYPADSSRQDGPALGAMIHAAVLDGLLSALTPLAIVFGALLLFRTLETSGAMAVLTAQLRRLTPDPVAQCVILGWSFSYLIEGLSGFGTPAALAAPVLAGLLGNSYSLLRIAALCLVLNSVPVSFGAVGTPTWFGLGGLSLSHETLATIGWNSALIHAFCAPIIVLLALRIIHPWTELRSRLPYILTVVAATVIPSVAVARFNSEFPSIIGGLCSLAAAAGIARSGWGLPQSPAQNFMPTEADQSSRTPEAPSLLRAAFPILAVILLLAMTRIGALGIKPLLNLDQPRLSLALGTLGQIWITPSLVLGWSTMLSTPMSWRMPLLYVPFLIPFVFVSLLAIPVLGMKAHQVHQAWRDSLLRLRAPAIALAGALILVKLLMLGNLLAPAMILGRSVGEATGQAWPWFAALLGALGSFFSGSNTVSNLTFGPIQLAIADTQQLPPAMILALQSVGGAMGNMVCIHNIVAVAAILGLREVAHLSPVNSSREPAGVAGILRLTFPPLLAYAFFAALAAAVLMAF